MFCPHCKFKMATLSLRNNESENTTSRIYECRKCSFKGVIETLETTCRSSDSRKEVAKRKIQSVAKQIAKDMRSMRHGNLSDLERQALRFSSGWVDRRYA